MKNIRDNIIIKCQKGNRDAFAQLYKLYAPKMFPICLRYSDTTQEAEDFLQNGFLIIFKKISTYKNKGSFEGWLKRVFVNNCLYELRKNKKIKNSINDNLENIENINDDDSDFKDIDINDLFKLINKLPTQYRLVFNMYVLDSYSHMDISKKLSISISTSKSNLSRAKQILKKKIKEKRRELDNER